MDFSIFIIISSFTQNPNDFCGMLHIFQTTFMIISHIFQTTFVQIFLIALSNILCYNS